MNDCIEDKRHSQVSAYMIKCWVNKRCLKMLAINKQIRYNFLWEQGVLSLRHQTIQWILILRSIELFVEGVVLWRFWELLHRSWLELVLEWSKDRMLHMRLLLHLNADSALVIKLLFQGSMMMTAITDIMVTTNRILTRANHFDATSLATNPIFCLNMGTQMGCTVIWTRVTVLSLFTYTITTTDRS